MVSKSSIGLFVFFIFSNVVLAQQKDSVIQMEQVTVTATRRATAIKQLPYAVDVLTRNDIEKQHSRTVPEALQGTTGIFIQKTNHAGGSPFLRGLTGNQSLILVDGIRLNNAIFRYGPNQYMTLVDPLIVDKIEVVKGTGSVLYGSDAMTGVINIQTRGLKFKDKPEWMESMLVRLTSDAMENTFRPELKYEGKKISFVIGADSKRFGDLKGGDTTGLQHPSGYTEKAFDVKVKTDLGKAWVLTAAYQWLRQNNVPVYHKYRLENFALSKSDPIQRGFGYVQLKKEFHGIVQQIEFIASRQFIQESRYSRKTGNNSTRFERDAIQTSSLGADIMFRFSSNWYANAGIEYYGDYIRSYRNDYTNSMIISNNKRGLYPDQSYYGNLAIYSMQHLQWKRFNVEAGVRYGQFQSRIQDFTLGEIQLTPNALVFQGGINYRLSQSAYFYVNMSEGYRAPNIDDLGTLGIVDFRYEIPTYDLKPEKSFNQEAGLKYVESKTGVSFSFFRTNLSGLISRVKTDAVINGYEVYNKINLDKAFINGWEAQAYVEPIRGLILNGNATYLYGQSITKGQPLRRIPPFNGRLVMEYRKGKLTCGLTYDHASPQRRLEAGDIADNRIPLGGTPGYNLLHAHASYILPNFSCRLYFSNIFNQDYRTHGSGINGMGRAISLMTIFQIKQFKKSI